MTLPTQFQTRMLTLLGDQYQSFIDSYSQPPKKGLLVNPLRLSPDRFLELAPFALTKISEHENLNNAFFINDEDKCGKHPYHMAGAYYIQEPSAMCVANILAELDLRDKTVLDLCAAPGGKTAALAGQMQGRGLLVSNEIVKNRAEELARNVERLGITNSVVTNCRPDKIAEELPSYFDVMVVDAPCSGEGMFRKNPKAALEWTPEHVTACAARQLMILESGAKCLKENGYLVYSTCTFSTEENEDTVNSFCQGFGFDIITMKRYYPHNSCGEGHFLCLMQKRSVTECTQSPKQKSKQQKRAFMPCENPIWLDFVRSTYKKDLNLPAYINDSGKVILASPEMLDIAAKLPTIACGVHAGYVKKGYFEPSHTLFMASGIGEYRLNADFAPDSDSLAKFLHGETISSPFYDSEKGYCLITTNGLPLGFCKVSEGMLKNKLPKGVRAL